MMNCQEAEERLYGHDAADGPVTRELRTHLEECGACQGLWTKLMRLESAVRQLPQPEGAELARVRFENRLREKARQEARKQTARPATRAMWIGPWKAAAAALLAVGFGVAMWMLNGTGNSADGAVDPIAQLVAWNLDLAEKGSAEDRAKLYSATAERCQRYGREVAAEDRELAKALLAEGEWLVKNDDALAEADHFTGVANQLLDRMDGAVDRPKALNRLGQTYCMVIERGVNPRLARLDEQKVADPAKKKRLAKIETEKGKHPVRLERVLVRCSKQAKPTIGHALDVSKKQSVKKAKGK